MKDTGRRSACRSAQSLFPQKLYVYEHDSLQGLKVN